MLSVRILAIQNIECETLGTLEGLFRSDGFEIDVISGPSGRVPSTPEGYAGIIILGGPMAVYDNHAFLSREQKLIRSAIKSDTPLLGICLGSQLIAQAAGGKVYRGSKKEIGWGEILLTHDGVSDVFRGIDSKKPVKVFQWHGDTYELPISATILARNISYPQAFRIASAIGIQFHLEVNGDMIRRWTEEYRQELENERIDPADLFPKRDEIARLESKCKVVYRNFATGLKSNAKL